MAQGFVTRSIYGDRLDEVPLDGIRRHCTRCNATHGYWSGGACMICRIGFESRRRPRPKLPDFSDPSVASQH